MKIKVSVAFLDFKALEKEIAKQFLETVAAQIPIPDKASEEEIQLIQEERGMLYDTLYDNAMACVEFFSERTYAIFDFDFEFKRATLIGVTDQ